MELVVIGGGSWGTAFSRLLANQSHRVTLWLRDKKLAQKVDQERENKKYLPGVKLPAVLTVETDLTQIEWDQKTIVLALPSFAVRTMVRKIGTLISQPAIIVNLAKGLEEKTFKTMSEVIKEELPFSKVFSLLGPSHAEEVGRDMPTTVVLAGEDKNRGQQIQSAFSTNRFRIYWSDNLKGIEYCSSIKNIFALAGGISDGLGFGDNSKAALLTRGLAEMKRLGKKLGIKNKTLTGLAGIGDISVTIFSKHSRNRMVGERIGKGENPNQIVETMDQVPEGVKATKVVYEIAQQENVDLPITKAVYRVIYENSSPRQELERLMNRELKEE